MVVASPSILIFFSTFYKFNLIPYFFCITSVSGTVNFYTLNYQLLFHMLTYIEPATDNFSCILWYKKTISVPDGTDIVCFL